MLMREQRALISEYLRNVDAAASDLVEKNVVPHPLVLVLDNVRSAHNVGSIFRTAETACVREIVTCGITPHPPNEKLWKTALSATHYVPTRHFESALEAVATLKSEGVCVIGMETTSRSLSYTKVDYPQPTALILGNEITGIDTLVMEACDVLVEIPTFGIKNSLNVASAAPVVIFEVLRRWGHL
ncbi:Alpha/beta knot methyltransferase [Baffinella frigidus]|nr:Alpha/beta knot methyltransferase [Cryptophyta sp. CCMP2293]